MAKLKIIHIYPKEMNIYGDNGNVQILSNRLKWLGYDNEIIGVGIGDNIPTDASVIVGGGGQDAGQSDIADDLVSKKQTLLDMSVAGMPMMMICGMYQMFGHYFRTTEGKDIPGIGVLDVTTVAGDVRMIGNIVVNTEKWGQVTGYENHSGKTYLGKDVKPIGQALKLQGNNGEDRMEGANINNVFGSYLHGPIFAKNTKFVDHFVELIIGEEVKSFSKQVKAVDILANKASEIATKLPR